MRDLEPAEFKITQARGVDLARRWDRHLADELRQRVEALPKERDELAEDRQAALVEYARARLSRQVFDAPRQDGLGHLLVVRGPAGGALSVRVEPLPDGRSRWTPSVADRRPISPPLPLPEDAPAEIAAALRETQPPEQPPAPDDGASEDELATYRAAVRSWLDVLHSPEGRLLQLRHEDAAARFSKWREVRYESLHRDAEALVEPGLAKAWASLVAWLRQHEEPDYRSRIERERLDAITQIVIDAYDLREKHLSDSEIADLLFDRGFFGRSRRASSAGNDPQDPVPDEQQTHERSTKSIERDRVKLEMPGSRDVRGRIAWIEKHRTNH